MLNGKTKLKILFIVIAVALLLSLTSAAFALFYRNIDIPVNGDTGTASISFTQAQLTGSALFAAKGDTYTKTLTVQNTGSVPLYYTLDLSIERGGLEQAVLLYLDGDFLGTLDLFFGEEETKEIAIDNPLAASQSYDHTISLEYHLGAGSYYSVAVKDFTLEVGAHARQLFADTDQYLFASNFYQLAQIAQNYSYSGYTVQLTGDVTLEGPIVINAPISLNLAGSTLTLGDYSLQFSYTQAGVSRIYSSRTGGGVVRANEDTGSIVVNTPSSYVRNEIGTPYLSVTAASQTVFVDAYESYLDELLQGAPIQGGSDIEGIYSDYFTHFEMAFSSTDTDIITSDMEIITPLFSKTLSVYFGFSGRTLSYNVNVLGSDSDSIADTVIRNNFYLLPSGYVFGTSLPVSGDVLLPTRDRQTGNPILWISSQRDILDETGKYNVPYKDVAFELSAIVTVNGVNILKIFPMTAISKSPEEKLREILLERGKITFLSFDHIQLLIDPALYDDKMELRALSYTIPENVNTVMSTIDNESGYKSLMLSGDPNVDSTYVLVTATFGGELVEGQWVGGITVSGRLDVLIDIVENTTYHASAYRLIMSKVTLLPQNTLYSFELPSNYRTTTTIEYIVESGDVGDIYHNPSGVEYYVIPKEDNTGITIVKENLPQENTVVTVEVKTTWDNEVQSRYFQISVAGVLHYSPQDIEDINLYQELRKIYDTNDDWIITRDEISASSITVFDKGAYHNIASIKGIEFFTKLTSISLNNNSIMDLSPLTALYDLTYLDLSNNSIQNIAPLKGIEGLLTLDLSYNDITDISPLKNKENLQSLTLSNNLKLSDFSAVAYMPSLQSVYLLNTLGVTSNDAENNNALMTAYQNTSGNPITLSIYKTSTSSVWPISDNLAIANTVANYINPIYEFYNVLYLPGSVLYNGITYQINWQCNVKEEDIVNIVKITGEDAYHAYIRQPAGDTAVKLSASLTHIDATIIKFFDVISRRSVSVIPQIYNGTTYVTAVTEIPDENLRRALFKMYDTDSDNYLSDLEIRTPRGDLDLSNLGITSLQGIGYFSDAITALVLDNNNLTGYQGLETLVNINTLSVNGAIKDLLTHLPALTNLTLLKVYGLAGANSEASLLALYNIYKNNINAVIYKDSTDAPWNPYIEPMAKALTNLTPYILDGETHIPQYLLYEGSSNALNLYQTLPVKMYDVNDVRWCSQLYERHILGYDGTRVNIRYDDCNPFGMIAGDFGDIETLSKHTSKTASDSTVVAFNSLSELFAEFMGNFEIPTDGTEYIPTIGSDALNNYTLFYNKAVELYDSSLVSFTKNISNNLTNSAVIGVNHPYTMTFGTDISPELINYQTIIANLFGFSSKTEFMEYAQDLADTYAQHRINILNSGATNEALDNGCFYTSNGSFVFPIAVKNKLSSTVLTYVNLDTSGLVSVWVNDITAALWATNFNSSYHTNSIIDNELYCKNILFVTGPDITADISYTRLTGSYTLNGNESVSLNNNAIPARDDYGQLLASITIEDALSGRTATVTKVITIVSVSDTDLYIETETGELVSLIDAVPNDVARRTYLARVPWGGPNIEVATGKRYIARSNYLGMTSLTFTGMCEYGIKGVELMKTGSSSLNRITINGYVDMPSPQFIGLDTLSTVDYPNINRLNINNSVVDLFDLTKLSGLQSLYITNSVKVVMDKVMEVTRGGITAEERLSVFGELPHDSEEDVFENKFPILSIFQSTNSNIRDFWALQDISVITLIIYSNPASTSALTNYYIEEAYSNLSLGTEISYRVISSSIYWTSSKLNINDLGVTLGSTAAIPYPYGVNYIELTALDTAVYRLPRMYNSVTENVFWTPERGGSAYTSATYAAYYEITFARPSLATTYIVIRGTVKSGLNTIAVVDYIFVNLYAAAVSDQEGYAKLGSDYYLDIRYAMMTDTGSGIYRFADFRFACYLLGLITDYNSTGLFKKEAVQASGLEIINNALNNINDSIIFNDIKGIRYFTGIITISLNNHTIADISELLYLQNLQYLSMYNNRIQGLKTSGGQSVFHNMSALYFVQLYLNPGISDFAPIVDRASSAYSNALTNIIVYQGDFTYYPAVIDDGKDPLSVADDDPQKILYMATTWWNRREAANITSDATLHIINGQALTTYDQLQSFFDCVNALKSVARPTGVTGNSNLGPSVTYNSVLYQLSWYAYGTGNAITVDAFGQVSQLSTELSYTNHYLKIRVVINLGSYEISRLMHIELAVQGNSNDNDLLVELNADEATKYNQKYGYATTYSSPDVYTVKAKDVIPDANFRNYLFSVCDINYAPDTKNGTISMADRHRLTSVSLTNKAIDDISGFELFYRVSGWTFEAGQMRELPELFIRNSSYNGSTTYGSSLVNLYIRRFYNLTSLIDGLNFDGDGAGNTNYTSLYDKLLRLDVQNCPNISDTQYAYIATMPILRELNIRYNRYSTIDIFYDLYDSITRLYASNNNANYANFNQDQYRRLVLDSPTLNNFNDVSYVSTVFKEYLALELYQVNVPKALPTTFQLKGYDRVYDLSWEEIVVGEENNYYTINEVGGVYYLTVETGAPATINARVSASYTDMSGGTPVTYTNTYSESVEIITLQDADLSDQYYLLDGTIWTTLGDVDIATVIPDPMLRYYFFKVVDTDTNEYISYTELGTLSVSFNESNATINSLQGIACLYQLQSLTINRFYGYDLSPLSGLSDTLTSLTLTSATYQLRDTALFDDFALLQEVNFNATGVVYFGFVMNNSNITSLKNITSSLARYSMFSRNAWAYSRMYNDLSDIGTNLGTDSRADLYYSYINTQDEKYASCILDAIDINMQTDDVFEAKTDEAHKLVLPPRVDYQGKSYDIEWLALSDKITIINGSVSEDDVITNGELAVSSDGLENHYAFVARITNYNGGSYERLFIVRY